MPPNSPHSDPYATLYPDVAAFGSLAAALRAAADGVLASVLVASPDGDPLGLATVACTQPHRGRLLVSAWVRERTWSIRGSDAFEGMPLIDGTTDDLAQVARAARAWHDGVPLDDIPRVAPFVHLTGRVEVPDNDPLRLTQAEWRHTRREAAELEHAWQPRYRELIEAAYAAPALRALYPFTSHWALRFSTTTRPRLTVVGPVLTHLSDRGYALGSHMEAIDDLGRSPPRPKPSRRLYGNSPTVSAPSPSAESPTRRGPDTEPIGINRAPSRNGRGRYVVTDSLSVALGREESAGASSYGRPVT
ncbi:DUF6193 family natural product biosynthesis protein [Yinghuangia sp. YIM S09857]|uniref:DUF6193 family natural product biosynthesis protein n=1 Tax=Yinghuangia sp. YIM S09857 TaxID=3436929 RepID=UPI003F538F53